jgi:hypothetical protein
MTESAALPSDLAVQCLCGGVLPMLFVLDGRPHNEARCPRCDRLFFLTRAPHVRATSRVA